LRILCISAITVVIECLCHEMIIDTHENTACYTEGRQTVIGSEGPLLETAKPTEHRGQLGVVDAMAVSQTNAFREHVTNPYR
jgi:hypothetical protein